jgi:hypothetical protein
VLSISTHPSLTSLRLLHRISPSPIFAYCTCAAAAPVTISTSRPCLAARGGFALGVIAVFPRSRLGVGVWSECAAFSGLGALSRLVAVMQWGEEERDTGGQGGWWVGVELLRGRGWRGSREMGWNHTRPRTPFPSPLDVRVDSALSHQCTRMLLCLSAHGASHLSRPGPPHPHHPLNTLPLRLLPPSCTAPRR